MNRETAVQYLNCLDRIFVFDGYAGWDPEVRGRHIISAGCHDIPQLPACP